MVSEGDQPPSAGSANAGWRPIETAPRDGTLILVADRISMGMAFWHEGRWLCAPRVYETIGQQPWVAEMPWWMNLPAKPEPREAAKPKEPQ
jgi:hypothetical protein